MILQELVRYYERLAEQGKVSKPGWCSAKVSYCLDLRPDGTVARVIPCLKEEERGKKKVLVPQDFTVPAMVSRSSGIAPNFLCDNSKYLLGIDKNGSGKRLRECFEAAKNRHLEILDGVSGEAAEAVRAFFKSWDPEKAAENSVIREKWEELTAGGNLIFSVGMDEAQKDESIRRAWEESQNKKGAGEEKAGVCLVTGKRTEIARIHNTIKGVSGAQSSGAALVSFNADSFTSYGKEQSYNAPVGIYAAFAYTTALNYLLSQRRYVFQLGDATVIFWSESGEEAYQQAFWMGMEAREDDQEKIRELLEAMQKGRPVAVDDISLNPEQSFCVLGLSPNAARLSVRFFYKNSFGSILTNLKHHYEQMEIVRPSWDRTEYMSAGRMLYETANQKSRDKKAPPNMAAAVFKSILSGAKYPESLYSNVLIRIRAESGAGKVTRGRAAIIKAYLIRNKEERLIKEGTFVRVNESCVDTAYVLGRIFAVLEEIQEKANPGLNSTIKDRYFNAACSRPQLIFPTLFKLESSHIRKLEDGAAIYYERQLTELQGMLQSEKEENGIREKAKSYPASLNLEEQGAFILGYYHQVQKRYTKKEDK